MQVRQGLATDGGFESMNQNPGELVGCFTTGEYTTQFYGDFPLVRWIILVLVIGGRDYITP